MSELANRPLRRRLIKMLGQLPLVADFMRRLQIERTVNELCPSRSNAQLTHGQVVLAVLANRLIQPQAMYHLLEWARKWAVGETFGFDAGLLNDDRLARCLDALAPQLDAVQGTVLARAVTAFQLDLSQLHWDLTSVVLDGEFDPEQPPAPAPAGQHPYPQPAYGYGGVSDQKQLRVGELVTGDGLVPVFHRSFDGNQADVGTVVALMETVRQHVSLPECLVIGDSKLLSADVIRQLRQQGLHFLAPLPRSRELDAEFLTLDPDRWEVLAYLSQEQAKRPEVERHHYWGQEVAWTAPAAGGYPPETLRRLYVISSEERETACRVRRQRLVKATEELNALLAKEAEKAEKRLQSGKATPKASSGPALLARAEQILAHRKVGEFVRVRLETERKEVLLAWELDSEALQTAERLDGYYVLLSSWPPEAGDASNLLQRWKQQAQAERRFHEWKGPLRLRPVFVTTPQRLAACMLLLHLALLVFCLIEREARRALAQKGLRKARNLLAGHVDAIPTGANILLAFDHLFLIVEEDPPERSWDVSPFSPVQADLWDLLGAKLPVWA